MEGGRKLENMVRYSGCIVIDIDDSPIPPKELLRSAYELPYVKAGHVSPSGTGGKLFILVDCELECHKPAFEIVRRRVEADIPGVTVDVTGKDPNRACFFSNDPGAFYKKDAEVLRVPVCDPSSRPMSPGRYRQPAAGIRCRTTSTSSNRTILSLPARAIPMW